MTFTAAPGYTVTLQSFNLAQFVSTHDSVNISVTGGSSPYSLTATPAGGTGNFTTYSPQVTGNSLTLTITNMSNVGLNEIAYSEAPVVASVPTLSRGALAGTALLLGVSGLLLMKRYRLAQ